MSLLSTIASASVRGFGGLVNHLGEPMTDPLINNVKLLMHMEGADNSQNFADEKGHVATPFGTALLSVGNPLYGSTSLYVDRNGQGSVRLGPSTDFVFPGDLCFEITFYLTAFTNATYVLGNYTANAAGHWLLAVIGSASLIWYINGGSVFVSVPGSLALNRKYKIALVRSGGQCTVYLDGVKVGASTAFSGNIGLSTNSLAIGSGATGTNGVTGYIDEVRLTDGYPRYLANYIPRNTPFPNS